MDVRTLRNARRDSLHDSLIAMYGKEEADRFNILELEAHPTNPNFNSGAPKLEIALPVNSKYQRVIIQLGKDIVVVDPRRYVESEVKPAKKKKE